MKRARLRNARKRRVFVQRVCSGGATAVINRFEAEHRALLAVSPEEYEKAFDRLVEHARLTASRWYSYISSGEQVTVVITRR